VVRPAREKIALLLRGSETTGSFRVETSAPVAGVTLSVDGVGPVRLPVGAAQERKLVSVARPAMFGLGEETLTDISVRDTWELTADQVSLGGEWERLLEGALVEVHEGLGLPRGARLRAELHALLSEETSPAPNRLVVLFDHQYSQRGLVAGRLKGRDVEWVSRLRAAADRAGC
jgi:hypothetical protein